MITIVDYGMGNLRSITKALAYQGGNVELTSDPARVFKADKIVLPGVGAFGDGMKNLRDLGLLSVLEVAVREKKKPFLGICLGMQLLAKSSSEFGEHAGLGWLDASVKRFDAKPGLKIPHVGWNDISINQSDHPLFKGIVSGADFYFVHSYCVGSVPAHQLAATADYGGVFTAAVAWDNIFATQFHPEKSQHSGLQMLKNFISWDPGLC